MELSAGFINLPGGSEWIIIFLVMLIIFGPKSLPKIGNAIGRGIREFKDASEGITKAIEEEASAEDNSDSTYDYNYDEPETSSDGETAEADTVEVDSDELTVESDSTESDSKPDESTDPPDQYKFED